MCETDLITCISRTIRSRGRSPRRSIMRSIQNNDDILFWINREHDNQVGFCRETKRVVHKALRSIAGSPFDFSAGRFGRTGEVRFGRRSEREQHYQQSSATRSASHRFHSTPFVVQLSIQRRFFCWGACSFSRFRRIYPSTQPQRCYTTERNTNYQWMETIMWSSICK